MFYLLRPSEQNNRAEYERENESASQATSKGGGWILELERRLIREPDEERDQAEQAKPHTHCPLERFSRRMLRACSFGDRTGGQQWQQENRQHNELDRKAHRTQRKNGSQPVIQVAAITQGKNQTQQQKRPQQPDSLLTPSLSCQKRQRHDSDAWIIGADPVLIGLIESAIVRLNAVERRNHQVRPSPDRHRPNSNRIFGSAMGMAIQLEEGQQLSCAQAAHQDDDQNKPPQQ